jgi:hypothetical protein
MQLPEDMRFNRILHAANERIPVKSLAFGMNAIYQAMIRGRGVER